jgi:hypothetical protein
VKRVLTCLLGLFLPAQPLGAQGSEPLRKTDLIRLLSSRLIRRSEVADLIRRNCLAFRPTERDWADLRDLGADADVMASIGGCVARAARPRPIVSPASTASAPDPVLPTRPAPLLVAPLAPRLGAVAGTDAYVAVEAKRGDEPEGGLWLALRGSSSIPGGAVRDVQAVTDESGLAVFSVPAGQGPGVYRLEVVSSAGATLLGRPTVDLVVRAGRSAAVDVQPSQVDLGGAKDGPLGVRVVAVGSVGTGFVSSGGKGGVARTLLPAPLVFQARSVSGGPLPGRVVKFRSRNAQVAPDSAVTDSAGRARVDVTLGSQAGSAVVTASLDSVEVAETLRVDPGHAVELILEREGMRVDGGRIIVELGVPFTLTVKARDGYGNRVSTAFLARALTDIAPRFNARRQLLKALGVRSDSLTASLTFKPTGLGTTDLTIAGGLTASVSVEVVPPAPRK